MKVINKQKGITLIALVITISTKLLRSSNGISE